MPLGPSDEVINDLHNTFNLMRQSQKLVRFFSVAAVVFAIVVAIAFLLAGKLSKSLAEEKRAARDARRLSTETFLQNGGTAIRNDQNVSNGVLWYAKAFRIAEDTAPEVRFSARSLIGGWSRSIPRYSLVHDDCVREVTFSPNGQTLATACFDGTARLWDVATGLSRGDPFEHGGFVLAVSFSPDGQTLATAGDDHTVGLWDVATGQRRVALLEHGDCVWAVTFSPDGQTLATGSDDKTARLWDAVTGEPLGNPLKHDGSVAEVTFSPDGQTLATTSDDYTARLWDVATSQTRGDPLRHDGPVDAVSFSPDGQTLATASNDETARLWDAASGLLRGVPLKHDGSVFTVNFSPDGQTLATAGADCTARLWDVPPPAIDDPELVWLSVEVRTGRTIENGLVRKLTQIEWLERKKKLDERGGDCLNRGWDDLSPQEREELRTPVRTRPATGPPALKK